MLNNEYLNYIAKANIQNKVYTLIPSEMNIFIQMGYYIINHGLLKLKLAVSHKIIELQISDIHNFKTFKWYNGKMADATDKTSNNQS